MGSARHSLPPAFTGPHVLTGPLLVAVLLASSGIAGCSCEDPPRTEVPELHAPRAASAPTLDGRLDEACWADAARTERFVSTMDGSHSVPTVYARVTWDDDALYVAFEVPDDTWLVSGGPEHDAHLWEHDAVELMIDPDGDGESYVELQVSPSGLVFDTWFDTPRMPQPFGHIDWSSELRAAVSSSAEQVGDGHSDEGWSAEIAIPWSAFSTLRIPASRPSPGDTWRIALYVLDERERGQYGAGWSAPLIGDFHVPARFGRVVF